MWDLIKKSWLLCWMLLEAGTDVMAQEILYLSDEAQLSHPSVPEHAEVLLDTGQHLTFRQVLAHPGFQANRSGRIEAAPGVACWLRFTVQNLDTVPTQWLLRFNAIDIFRIVIYTRAPDGTSLAVDSLGSRYPFGSRPLKSTCLTYPFSLNVREVKVFYVHVDNHFQALATGMQVLSLRQVYESEQQGSFIGGIVIGGSLVYLLTALALIFLYRRLIHIYFGVYVLGAVLYLFGSMGYGFRHIWPAWPSFQAASPYFGLALVLIGYCGMFHILFRLRDRYRKIHALFIVFTGLFALLAIGFLAWPYLGLLHGIIYFQLYRVEAIGGTACLLVSLAVGARICQHHKGYFWLLSLSGLLISAFLLFVLMKVTLLKVNEQLKPVLLASVVFCQTTLLVLLWLRKTDLEKAYYQNQIITERENMVADLHDEVLSIIAGIRISFGLIRRKIVDADLQDTCGALDEKISKVIEQVRDLTGDLRSGRTYLAGMAAELYSFAREQFELSAIKLHFKFARNCQPLALPLVVQRNLRGFFKEAIHNCLKYAQARNCWIQIERSGNLVYCRIKDDGQGFDLQQGWLHPSGEGNGLRNFRRRAQKMQADYSLVTQPGQGVEIRLTINLLKLTKLDVVLDDVS